MKLKKITALLYAVLAFGCGSDAEQCKEPSCEGDNPTTPAGPVFTSIKTNLSGYVLSPEVECDSCVPDKYEYQWITNGEVISTNKDLDYTLDDGEITLRVFGYDESQNRAEASQVLAYKSPKIYESYFSFGILAANGDVYAVGSNADTSPVEHLLKNVTELVHNGRAWLAITKDRKLVSFGDATYGGDNNAIPHTELSNFVSIKGAPNKKEVMDGFSVLLSDGTIRTFGGSLSYHKDDKVYDKHSIVSGGVHVGISDGAATFFGTGNWMTGWETVKDEMSSGITEVFGHFAHSYAALKMPEKKLLVWGSDVWGGDHSAVAHLLESNVEKVIAGETNMYGMAAIRSDKTGVIWGDQRYGYFDDYAPENWQNVENIYSSHAAYAGLRSDGSVVAIGNPAFGGDSSSVADALSSGVKSIVPSNLGFAAIKGEGENKSLVVWGRDSLVAGADEVAGLISSGIKDVSETSFSYAVLKSDGSALSFGEKGSPGSDYSTVADELSGGVRSIHSTMRSHLALKEDGSVVHWGSDSDIVPDNIPPLLPEIQVISSSLSGEY